MREKCGVVYKVAMPKHFVDILSSALLSSGIFLGVLLVGLDVIFMFLATLPLFSAGLGKSPKIALKASLLATAIIAAFTASFAASSLFLLVFALPSSYICYAALKHYDIVLGSNMPTLRIWYPIGLITINLAIYGNIILAITTAILATQETTMPQQLTQMINSEITTLSKNYDIELKVSAENIAFMLCGFLVWLWSLLIIASAWIANKILTKTNLAKRPNLTITPFPMPHWMLTIITIWALASLIGGESMSFLGKASVIIMLLPYFYQGMALLHLGIRNWPNRQAFLIIFYITVAIFWWPAMVMAGVGLWNHIKIFNKHLSSGGSSSKS